MKPGIYFDLPNEQYHASEGVSKSGLWTLQTQSPVHYKFAVREEKNHFDLGTAIHTALLEPEKVEAQIVRGPDDRRGNKWKDLAEVCKIDGKILLTSGDYDDMLAIRDAVHADATVNSIITGGIPIVEASGYINDPVTGELIRVRPDLYRDDIGIMVDVKSCASAHPDDFARSVVNYGYHAQEAFYSDAWRALGKPVEGFLFLAFEKKSPYAFSLFELPPSIVEEGRALMRQALDTYHECRVKNEWPGYGSGVQELSFKRWAYRLTEAPDAIDEQAAA